MADVGQQEGVVRDAAHDVASLEIHQTTTESVTNGVVRERAPIPFRQATAAEVEAAKASGATLPLDLANPDHRSLIAGVVEMMGQHEAAAHLRGEVFKNTFFDKSKRVWNARIQVKHVVWIVVGSAVVFIGWEAIAAFFDLGFSTGLFKASAPMSVTTERSVRRVAA